MCIEVSSVTTWFASTVYATKGPFFSTFGLSWYFRMANVNLRGHQRAAGAMEEQWYQPEQ